jgi:proteic killer suppression protein
MIKSFEHKGLERLYEKGSHSGVQAKHAKKLRMQLAALDTSQVIEDIDLPGYRLHPLIGDRANRWAIDVSGNWRLTFNFDSGDLYDLDYEDYP